MYVCVFTTAVAVIAAWRKPSQVLPPWLTQEETWWAAQFPVCLSRRVSLWGQSNTLMSECLSTLKFWCQCTCVHVMSCLRQRGVCRRSHAVPQSSWHGERQREFSLSWRKSHVSILLIPKLSQCQDQTKERYFTCCRVIQKNPIDSVRQAGHKNIDNKEILS